MLIGLNSRLLQVFPKCLVIFRFRTGREGNMYGSTELVEAENAFAGFDQSFWEGN